MLNPYHCSHCLALIIACEYSPRLSSLPAFRDVSARSVERRLYSRANLTYHHNHRPFLTLIIRELKQRRRWRQRERQKSNRFRFAKQQLCLCTCITLFCKFLCRLCTTTAWRCLISRFVEDVNPRRLPFSFPELWYSLLEFSSRNICQHLTIANWTSWNNCDKVWSSANSLFKWRFRSRRRRCCLISLLWSMRSLLYKEIALCRYHNVSKVSLEPARSGDRLAYKLSWKVSQARSASSRNEKRRTLRKSSQGTEGTVNQKNNSQASIGAL